MKKILFASLILSAGAHANTEVDYPKLKTSHINNLIEATASEPLCGNLDTKTKDSRCTVTEDLPSWVNKRNTPDILFTADMSFADRSNALKSMGCDAPVKEGDDYEKPTLTLVAHLPDADYDHEKVVPWSLTNCVENIFIIPENYDPHAQNDITSASVKGRQVVDKIPRIARNLNLPLRTQNFYIGGFHVKNDYLNIATQIRLRDTFPGTSTFSYAREGGLAPGHPEGINYHKQFDFHLRAFDSNGLHAGFFEGKIVDVNIENRTISFSDATADEIRSFPNIWDQTLGLRNTFKDGRQGDALTPSGYANVVIQNVKIDTISDYGLRALNTGDTYLDRVEFGSLAKASKIANVDTSVHLARLSGKFQVTNSIFAKSFDDHLNFYSSRGIMPFYEKINQAGTKFRACVMLNEAPEVGETYQAIAPEVGRVDYMFKVNKIIVKNNCNRIRDANYKQHNGTTGWQENAILQPYFVLLEIDNLNSVSSPTQNASRISERYAEGYYAIDSTHALQFSDDGITGSVNYDLEGLRTYYNGTSDTGDDLDAQSEHYVLFNASERLGGGRIQNNIFINAGKNAIVGKSHSMSITDNIFINSRKGDVGLSVYTRGVTLEGPLSFNNTVANNTFINELTNSDVPGIEIISQGWSNRQTAQNQAHWETSHSIHSNDCYNNTQQPLIYQKNTKEINSNPSCSPLNF